MGTLRDLFRGLQAFESFYESDGITTVRDPSGIEWSVWDVRYLYDARRHLSARQGQAIEVCLYHNVKETEAAVMMGIEPQSPVCIYATNGLKRIIAMVEEGLLPKFRAFEEASAA